MLASSTGANGTYSFASSFRLTGGQQYFAYSDTSQDVGLTTTNAYTGGMDYESASGTTAFQGVATDDNAFRVTGIAAAAPEPATWALMILGFGMAGYVLRRRKVVLGGTVAA